MTGVEEGIAIAGIVTAVAGTAVSVVGQMQAASAASDAANYNATVARNNAIAAQQQAQQTALIQQQQARQKIGGITAAYGASGIDTGSGSPLDALANSASNAELDRQTILYHGAIQAAGYGDEASLDAARIGAAQSSALTSSAGLLLNGGAKAFTAGKSLLTSSSSSDIPANVDAPGSSVGFGGSL